MLRFSVILPTHDRPDHLRACLLSLLGQVTSIRYEVIVVRRDDDARGKAVIRELCSSPTALVREVEPGAPGFLRALRAGLAAADGEFVAFTDDDAVYPSDWLDRLSAMLDRPGVGGAGGTISESGQGRVRKTSRRHCRITVTGRLVGNAYDTLPSAVVDVDVLPGANMAYRRDLVNAESFPLILDFNGGAPGNETLVGALVRKRGFRLLCETSLVVDHHRAPRADGNRAAERGDRYRIARSRAFIMRHALSPFGFRLFLLRVMVIGERELPGLVRLALERRLTRSGGRDILAVARGFRAGRDAARDPRLWESDAPCACALAVDVSCGCSPSS